MKALFKKLIIIALVGAGLLIAVLLASTLFILGTTSGKTGLCRSHKDIVAKVVATTPEKLEKLKMIASDFPKSESKNPELRYFDFQQFALPMIKGPLNIKLDKGSVRLVHDKRGWVWIARDGFEDALKKQPFFSKLMLKFFHSDAKTAVENLSNFFSQDFTTCDPNEKGLDILRKISGAISKSLYASGNLDNVFVTKDRGIFAISKTREHESKQVYFLDVSFKIGKCGWALLYKFDNESDRCLIIDQISQMKEKALADVDPDELKQLKKENVSFFDEINRCAESMN